MTGPRAKDGWVGVVPKALLRDLDRAFGEKTWPGAWDQGSVHEHEPPFCLFGKPTRDCSLRVMEMLRTGMSFKQIEMQSGMRRRTFMEGLHRAGFPMVDIGSGRAKRLSPAQQSVVLVLWNLGWSAKEIEHLVVERTGRVVPTRAIYVITPPRVPSDTVSWKISLQYSIAKQLLELSKEKGITPAKLAAHIIARSLALRKKAHDDEA